MKTRHFTIFTFLFLFSISLQAQLPDGSIGPDFTVTDIDNNTHNLYDILDEGKSVILDFSATWCGPCWNYHQTHRLQDLYAEYGPNGTNEIEIFMLEASYSTNTACIYGPSGCIGGTLGNWTIGVDYPIVNLTSSNGGNVKSGYSLAYYPTLYMICPGRKVYEVGQTSYQGWVNRITSCNLASTAEITNEICFEDGNDEVDQTIEGGYGNITFSWSNGQTTEDIAGFGSGDYSCTITDWYGHSIEAGPFTVDGPSSELVANIVNQGDVNCNGNNNGFIDINVAGGEPGYQYLWSNNETTEDLNNIPGGSYSVTVTDNFDCTESLNSFVNEPPLLTLTSTSEAENCGQQDGIISLIAEGGTGDYTYDIGDGPTPINVFFDLSAGSYDVTVSDDNDCFETSIAVVGATPPPNADAGDDEEISCDFDVLELDGSNSSTGINIIYTWSTNDGNIVEGEDTQTPTIDQPGTYTISVLNIVSGCESFDTVAVEGSIDAPIADAGVDDELNCDISVVTLDGSNSSTGDSITYEWIDENDDVISTEVTIDVDLPGTYWLVVLNTENNCSKIDSVSISENIAVPVADAGETNELTCIVSTVTLDGSGSSTGDEFAYEWQNSNGNTIGTTITIDVSTEDDYMLIVQNTENGCTASANVSVTASTDFPDAVINGDDELTCSLTSVTLDGSQSSSGDDFSYEWLNSNNEVISTEINIEVDISDTYTLVVSDNSNGCTASTDFIVDDNTQAPEIIFENQETLNCINQTITLDASNSVGNDLSFEWQNESGNPIGNTASIEVSEPGTFSVTILDQITGCENAAQITVEENTTVPYADAGDGATLHCNLTSVELDATNSAMGSQFSYIWTTDQGNIISGATTLNPIVDAAGTYTLTILDSQNGCEQSATVEIDMIPEITIDETIQDIRCFGEENGSVNLNIDGGLDPFTYEWSNGANTQSIENLNAGSYAVTVSDDNDCSAEAEVSINEPDQINLTIEEIVNETNGNSNGEVQISVVGGVEPFSYEWMLNAQLVSNDEDLIDAQAGEYQVIITDANGCVISSETIVIDNITATIDPVLANYINVLPNPTTGNLFVNIDLPESRMINLALIDITGRVVLKTENENVSTKQYELDLNNFTDGLYILKIATKDGIYTEKLVLEKL